MSALGEAFPPPFTTKCNVGDFPDVRIRGIVRSLIMIMRVSQQTPNLALVFASHSKWSSSLRSSANAFRAKIHRPGEVPVFPKCLTSVFLSCQLTSAFKGEIYIYFIPYCFQRMDGHSTDNTEVWTVAFLPIGICCYFYCNLIHLNFCEFVQCFMCV